MKARRKKKLKKFNHTVIIEKCYKYNLFQPFIIYGPYGYGKSSFSIKILMQVYNTTDWDTLRNYIFFHPREFINALVKIMKSGEREKCIVWDDAGFWLYNLEWYDRFVKCVSKYLSVARTHLASIIFTTPTPTMVIKKVRDLPQLLTTKIIKLSNDRFPSQRYKRRAITYQWWRLPDMKKSGVKPKFVDDFDCRLPDDIYEQYMNLRKEYADYAILMMKQTLKDLERLEWSPQKAI